MIVKRCILGTLAGVLLALGVYYIVDTAVVFADGGAAAGDTLADWLWDILNRERGNEFLFDLFDALWFFRFIGALLIFDLLYCVAEKRYSTGMLAIAVAQCALLAFSLVCEPLSSYAREVLCGGSYEFGEARILIGTIGGCKLLVAACMTGLAVSYVVVKSKSRKKRK